MGRLLAYFGMVVALLLPAVPSASPLGPITKVIVTQVGIGPKGEGCDAFVITEDQARVFFEKAVLISGRQQHDFFLYGPCAARGTLETRYDTWHWEIRSLGTGQITATNGDTFLLADPAQESFPADE